jgi:hypothetical protein
VDILGRAVSSHALVPFHLTIRRANIETTTSRGKEKASRGCLFRNPNKNKGQQGTCSCDVVANRNDNAAPLPPASSTPNVVPMGDESRGKRRRRWKPPEGEWKAKDQP